METLILGQEVTGECIEKNKYGYIFLSLDDKGEAGIRDDLFVHISEFKEGEFNDITLGTKIVCSIGKDEINRERIKGVSAKIIK